MQLTNTFSTLPVTLRYLLGCLALALVYVLVGRLGLLLAVPPGFVTPIFPALGIAVAAVLLWGLPMLFGVLLGSTLLNLSLGAATLSAITGPGVAIAVGIALGSTAQCALASFAIKRWLGADNPLQDERSIIFWLLIAGPLTCLLSALIGSGVLWLGGVIGAQQWPFMAWTWWLGDSLGVMLIAPVVLMLFAKPAMLWRPRLLSVALPLLISCAIMLFIFLRASAEQQERMRLEFEQQSGLVVQALEARLMRYGAVLQSMERFFVASGVVSDQMFAKYVEDIERNYPELTGLSWNPLVRQHERRAFEESQQDYFKGFHIREFNAQKQVVPATERTAYVPVAYIYPKAANEKALGLDISTEPNRNAALGYARNNAALAMSAPIQLVQGELGVLMFFPVYEDEAQALDSAQKATALRGYATAVVKISRVAQAALANYHSGDFAMLIEDRAAPVLNVLFGDPNYKLPAYAEPLRQVVTLHFGGRALDVQLLPSESFLQRQRDLQPWLLLTVGLLLSSLLGAFLLAITGRSQAVEVQVRERTFELSSVLNNAAEGIVIMDQQGQFMRANPAAKQLLGIDGDAHQVNLQSVLREVVNVAEFLNSGLDSRVEWAMRDMHHRPLDVEASLSRYLLPDGLRYLALLRDISSRKQIERMKREFIATVSHELRTPLTSIKGSLGLLAGGVGGELNQQAKQLIDISRANADRLVSLVNDILDIERLELGHKQLDLIEHSVNELLSQALVLNAGFASSFNVTLRGDCAELNDNVRIKVDAQALQQVLSNLISNAVKFSPEGDEVVIRGRLQGDRVHVAVVDHGPGISAEFHSRIFAKFAQADSSDTRQRGGTGLGLSISKALIEAMGGEIGFTSREGQGSTFYFELPLVRD